MTAEMRSAIDCLNRAMKNRSEMQSWIKEYQNIVWAISNIAKNDEETMDILSTLAYDLDYYESDVNKRGTSYIDEKRAAELIEIALEKLSRRAATT